MRRIVLTIICLVLAMSAPAQEKKILNGFDGGMMVHTGYLSGMLDAIGYQAKGAPMGIGGVIHLHLGDHFRIGTEGYMSTLRQRGNGSYLKYGWGGPMHLTLKVDYLCALSDTKLLPHGPRVYIGFLFYH